MEEILRIINSDPELKAKFETAVDNYCNSREWQLVLAWKTKKHNLTGDQLEALTFALEWADSHPNWTSVDDELPKEDGTYWFYNSETQGVYASYFWADLTLNENISHWMRIKKPVVSNSENTGRDLEGGEQ